MDRPSSEPDRRLRIAGGSAMAFTIWLFRVYCEGVFSTNTQGGEAAAKEERIVFTTKWAMILRSPAENENGGISFHMVPSSTRHSPPRGKPGLLRRISPGTPLPRASRNPP